jgi:hypothetical protein
VKVCSTWLREARARALPPPEFGDKPGTISLLRGLIRVDHIGTEISNGLIDLVVVVVLMAVVILQVMSYMAGYDNGYSSGVRDAWAQRDRPRGTRGR